MKAIVIHDYGPPDVLRYEDVPDPVPRQGEIRIKVHAATVNRVLDVSLRAGREQYRYMAFRLAHAEGRTLASVIYRDGGPETSDLYARFSDWLAGKSS